jgi:glycosyltransferase involved in cell wall biosynthesis
MDISVVIPAYNAARYLGDALASVAAQTRAPVEVIVVDDGSTDATAEIAAAAGARVIRQANGGASAARNAGVAIAHSPWIAFLDADDRWLPRFIERVSAAAQCCPDVAAIFTDYILDDPSSPQASWFGADRVYRALRGTKVAAGIRRFSRGELTWALVRSRAFISTSAFAVRRTAFNSCGGFDQAYRRAEDLELMLRLFARMTAAAVEEPLSVYRKHQLNLTADQGACAQSERRVWRAVIAHPDRYTYSLARELSAALPARIRNDGVVALRQARFADALADLGESAQLGDRLAACVYPFAQAANSGAGRACYPGLRSTARTLRALLRPRAASP